MGDLKAMSDFGKAFFLMGVGLAFVFAVQIVFYLVIKLFMLFRKRS